MKKDCFDRFFSCAITSTAEEDEEHLQERARHQAGPHPHAATGLQEAAGEARPGAATRTQNVQEGPRQGRRGRRHLSSRGRINVVLRSPLVCFFHRFVSPYAPPPQYERKIGSSSLAFSLIRIRANFGSHI